MDSTNSAVMQILNLRIIYVFLAHALLCFFFADELVATSLGKAILIGSSLFWLGRTIEQFIYKRQLPFYHPISIFLLVLFMAGSVIYLVPLL